MPILSRVSRSAFSRRRTDKRNFESSEVFRHVKGLRSEPESPQGFVSEDRESRELAAPSLQVLEHSITCSGAKDVLREFNRDTLRVAVALLGILLLAVLLFVVLFPEREAKSDSSSAENAATLFRKTVPESGTAP